MKKHLVIAGFCLILILISGNIFAQQNGYTGPVVPGANNQAVVNGQYKNVTVSQLTSIPHKSYVVLTGDLINFDGHKYYTFRDSTGEITIEISNYYFWDITVGPNEKVKILVEVERKRNGKIEVEAKGIRKA